MERRVIVSLTRDQAAELHDFLRNPKGADWQILEAAENELASALLIYDFPSPRPGATVPDLDAGLRQEFGEAGEDFSYIERVDLY